MNRHHRSGPRRLPKILSLAVAGAVLTAGLAAATPASAAPSSRLVPVAGTGHYLVYGTYTSATSGRSTVALRSRDRAGRIRSLGSITTGTATAIPATASASVLVAPKDSDENYRWDLSTGVRTTIPAGTVAAPGGYAMLGTNGATGSDARRAVLLVTKSGTTNIGVPFPDDDAADDVLRLSSGSAGVTVTDGHGHIRYIAFAAPGTVRSLHTVNRGANVASLSCPAFTSTSVACTAFDEETTTLISIRLDRSRVVRTAPRCVGTPAALHTAIAWVGCGHRLQVLDSTGAVRGSAAAFGGARPVSAYGKVVLQSTRGTKLQTMTGSGSTPKTIVSIR